MDYIEISGIRCRARIGVPDQERRAYQELRVDVSCGFDFTEATEHDNLALSVDYEKVVDLVQRTAEASVWALLETLTATLCRALLLMPRMQDVEVRVRKYPVDLQGRVDSVSAVMRRCKAAGS